MHLRVLENTLTVIRTLVAAIAAESLLVHGGLVNGYFALFHLPSIFKFPFPEIWRLITPFLLTGSGFNALWDLYMFWTYTTQLETNSPRFSQPGDFATYVAFIAISIVVSRVLPCETPPISARSDFVCLIRFQSGGRLPLRDMQSIIRKTKIGLYVAWAWWWLI